MVNSKVKNEECPDVCRVRLRALEKHMAECLIDRRKTYKHWEE